MRFPFLHCGNGQLEFINFIAEGIGPVGCRYPRFGRGLGNHDDPDAVTIDTWTEWVIDLQAFADQGVNLADVDKIAIGLGGQGTAGGVGTVFIDDVRLDRPTP